MGGVLPIPFSEICAYANEYRITGEDQRDRLIFYVQSMDTAYMQHMSEQSKSATETKT